MNKNILKKILFVALFALLLTCCLVIGIAAAPADDAAAVAAGYVARTGEEGTDTYYATVKEAVAAAPDGGTVTLIADSAMSASLNLTKSITLAGNGVISTSAAKTHTIVLGGNVRLAVTGNVEVKATGSGSSAIYQETSANTEVVLSGNAKVTSSYWTINYNNNTGTTATVKVSISDNVTVTGQYGITINKNFLLKLTMTGGTINATAKDGVYVDSTDTATKLGNEISISGGEIKAKGTGFNLKGKSSIQMTMTGGSVTSDYGVFIQGNASIALSMTGGEISALIGIYVTSKGVCRLELLGGSVTGTGSGKYAAVWLSPAGNGGYDNLKLTVDGATLTGAYYAICCQGGSATNRAYMTVAIKESDSAKPTVLQTTTDNAEARTIRMVDGTWVDLQISGGTISTTGQGDSLIYGSGAGYTKLTLSGGNFTAKKDILYSTRKMDVTLTGSFGTGAGQTGSFGTPARSVFCTGGGAMTYTVDADITSATVIFRAQAGTQTVTINGGHIVCDKNIAYNTFTEKAATTTTNVTVNGGDLTTNNKSDMFYAVAGTLNVSFYGGNIHDGLDLVHYNHVTTSGYENFAKGLTLINMASGSISTSCSIFVSNGSSEGNVRVVKGDITCTTSADQMWILARWGAPNAATGGTATSDIVVEGGNFNFSNAGNTRFTAPIGMKGTSTANVTISGGNLDGGNYGIYTACSGASSLNLTMTGGKITARTGKSKNAKTGKIESQGGSVLYSNCQTTVFRLSGGTLTEGNTTSSAAGINIKANVNADIEIGGSTVINVKSNAIMSQNGDTGTSLKLKITGGTITSSTASCVSVLGATKTIDGSEYTAILDITGGTFTSKSYTFTLGQNNVENIKMTFGGTAKATASDADNGYFLVLSGKTLLDLEVTGGTVNTKRASIHLNSTLAPTAERPFPAVVTMTGGSITSGDVALNIKNTCLVDFTMTGGTLRNDNANTAVIRNDNVINADTDLTYASRIEIGENATLIAKGIGILVQNGAMDVVFKGVRVFDTLESGLVHIKGGKSGYASTVTMDGGTYLQPIEKGGYVFYNGNPKTTFNIKHGLQAYGARGMIVNCGGNAPATTLPGSNPDAIYAIGAPVMQGGASVRMVAGSNGLRFISHIDAATVSQIVSVADAGTVAYGTLIFPASYLNGLTQYTHGTIPKYLDIEAKDGLVEDGEGGYDIRAAIVNILESNYERDFVAIAYAKYRADGTTHYRYSAMQILRTSRNIRQVAAAALADTSATRTGRYVYLTENGDYSPYTSTQREVLKSYNPTALKTIDLFMITGQSNGSGYSNFGSEFKDGNPKYTAGFSNVLYSGYACSGSGINPYRWGTLIPVPTVAGYGLNDNYIGAELGLAEMLSNAYNPKTGRTAAILKYADGGTFLSDYVGASSARQGNWTPPSYLAEHGATDEVLSGNLYRNFLILVEQTVEYYRTHGYQVNVCGMFWMQGEAERNYYNGIPALGNEEAVASPTVEQVNALYTNLFKALVADTRKDIGKITGQELSAMPVIAGSISEAFGAIQSDNQTNFVEMQKVMVNATEHTYLLPETRYLTTGTSSADTAHYSVDDMVFAGNRLGAMFLTLYGEEASIPAPAESDYVAEVFVDGVSLGKYTNLGFAVNNAPESATVKLLRDLTLYGPLNFATPRKGIVVDGNGFTVESYSVGHAMKIIGYQTDITLHNFRLINRRDNVNDAYGIYMYTGATLNITGENSYLEAYRYGIVINQVSTVNISGGTFTTRNGAEITSAAIFVNSASKLNISGGNFKGVNSGAAIYLSTTASTVTITGGTFTPGATAQYAIYSDAAGTVLNISGANITKGTKGSVYNKNTNEGTQTY